MERHETGGGGHIGRDVGTDGGDFVGRDAHRHGGDAHVNIDVSQRERRSLSYEDRIRDLERYVFGEERYGEIGMIHRQRMIYIVVQVSVVLNMLILLAMLMLWLHIR